MRPSLRGDQTISYRTTYSGKPRGKRYTLPLPGDVKGLNKFSFVQRRRKHKQRLIFFVSKSLSEAETRYTRLEQATLALRVAAKKLRPYFQAHPIVVLANLPLRSTIHKPNLSRRMTRWAIELSEFVIQYKPRLTLKGQILEDFLA